MLNQTRAALEKFDNQHEFERLAADLLNALGYSGVEPMAPLGGADGGQDIKFSEAETPGIACVTLEKRIKDKFKRDLEKQEQLADGVLAFFFIVDVTPQQKAGFARLAIVKGYRLEVFDLERLRSLLDASLTEIRRRYLGIDDSVTAKIRADVRKLLKYPEAVPDDDQSQSLIEQHLVDGLPRRLFVLLAGHAERDIEEVPSIGEALQKHLKSYHEFRKACRQFEGEMLIAIGQRVGVQFRQAWQIYYRYAIMRCGCQRDVSEFRHNLGGLPACVLIDLCAGCCCRGAIRSTRRASR